MKYMPNLGGTVVLTYIWHIASEVAVAFGCVLHTYENKLGKVPL